MSGISVTYCLNGSEPVLEETEIAGFLQLITILGTIRPIVIATPTQMYGVFSVVQTLTRIIQ